MHEGCWRAAAPNASVWLVPDIHIVGNVPGRQFRLQALQTIFADCRERGSHPKYSTPWHAVICRVAFNAVGLVHFNRVQDISICASNALQTGAAVLLDVSRNTGVTKRCLLEGG